MKKMAGTRLELPATPKLLGTSGICNPHNYGDCGDLLLATDVGICVGPYITTIVYYGASDPLLYVYVYIYIHSSLEKALLGGETPTLPWRMPKWIQNYV